MKFFINGDCMSKKKLLEALNILEKEYSGSICGLEFNSPLELTVALILAAQCTDKRVNQVRPILFEKYKDVYSLANSKPKDIEQIIHSCGFYKNKTKNIIQTANILIDKYNGNVPSSMDELTTLAGIGRKSSNIILQECFDVTIGIAVDTHVTRLSNRIGFTKSINPVIIEKDLMSIVPKRLWNKVNHIFVSHGRAICDSRNPKCEICSIKELCRSYKKFKK